MSSHETIVESLRGRILRGLAAGTLEAGDRLPSTRDLAAEFDVEHRVVLGAYRDLASEGLVDVRERGGIYVASQFGRVDPGGGAHAKWLVDTFTEGLSREIAACDLPELMRRSIETLRLRAVAISTTLDQVAGLSRELEADFGLHASGVLASDLSTTALPKELRQADIILATEAYAELAQRYAAALNKPCIVLQVRPDLVVGEWAMLLRQPVWAIVATAQFGDMLRAFFADVPGAENLNVLVYGRDDLEQIPEGALTYVTARVRETLTPTALRGRILPPARTIARESARQLFEFIISANLRAVRAWQMPGSRAPSNPG